VLEPSWSYSAF